MKYLVLKLTPLEFETLNSMVDSVDRDGDHQEWLISAGCIEMAKACVRVKKKIKNVADRFK